jgi:hypothetical protein
MSNRMNLNQYVGVLGIIVKWVQKQLCHCCTKLHVIYNVLHQFCNKFG